MAQDQVQAELDDREIQVLEAVLADRWHMATTDAQMFENESKPSSINSEAETNLIESIRLIATRMVHEVGNDEEGALDDLEFTLLGTIEEHMLDFARQIETARADRRKVVAA